LGKLVRLHRHPETLSGPTSTNEESPYTLRGKLDNLNRIPCLQALAEQFFHYKGLLKLEEYTNKPFTGNNVELSPMKYIY